MKKFRRYVADVVDEMKNKVSWPTWSELQSSSIVVSIASLIIALVVLLMDVSFQNIMNLWYGV
jgi:preprotein translocase subunit SecE